MNTATTWLFVPGDRPDRFAKGAAAGADEIVIDLEDAVAPEHKVVARKSGIAWLAACRPAWIHINAHRTTWYDDDIDAIADLPGLRGVMVPKSEDAAELARLSDRLPANRGIIALVETARGVRKAHDTASAQGVERLAFGSIDFGVDIDAAEDDQALLLARSTVVLASRVAGLAAPVDGVTVATRDSDAVAAAAHYARRLGFGGKLCIHPNQVAPAAAVFVPSEDEIAWARTVVDAAADDSGVVGMGDQMIDRPVVMRAERILARAARSA